MTSVTLPSGGDLFFRLKEPNASTRITWADLSAIPARCYTQDRIPVRL